MNWAAGRLLDCCSGCATRDGTLHWHGDRFTAEAVAGGDRLIMPPLANAHDHVRGVRPISLGAFDLPLELWLLSLTGLPAIDPRLVTAAALGRQARGGLGSVMVHYTRPQYPDRLGARAAHRRRCGTGDRHTGGGRGGDARPEPARLRPRCRLPRCARPGHPRARPVQTAARPGAARPADRARRRTRRRGRGRRHHRPIRSLWPGMVLAGAAARHRRTIDRHRAACAHAPAGVARAARLSRRDLPAGPGALPRRDRLAVAPLVGGPCRPTPAGRDGPAGRARRDRRHQHQLQCDPAQRRCPGRRDAPPRRAPRHRT